MTDPNNELLVQERSLIASIFELITRFGFASTTDNRTLTSQSVRYDTVRVTSAGTYRLVVNEFSTQAIGDAVTYVLTFDPASKFGLVFDHYLEGVTIHLIGVTKQDSQPGTYRECVIEVLLKNPTTHLKVQKHFIVKTDKDEGLSRVGVPWLEEAAFLTFQEAAIIVEILSCNYN